MYDTLQPTLFTTLSSGNRIYPAKEEELCFQEEELCFQV